MLSFTRILTAGLLLASIVNAQQDQSATIEYNVISLLNQTTFKSMAVVVDNVIYPLQSNTTFPILFSGKAPLAQSGYHYAKMYTSSDGGLEEPFSRQPINESTPHEFFNRTWNTHENAQFPQLYPYLDSVHRIQSNLHRDNEIPTIHIVGNDTMLGVLNANITGDVKVKTNVSYISLHDAFQYQDVEISLAGNSARMLPKLSYNLKLKKKDDLYGYRRLKLRSLYLDPSYIREQLAYDFIKSMGLVSSEFSFVRVFMNERELGLFGIIDTFKSNWLSNVFADGSSSYKNGYLYQGLSGSGNLTSDLSYMTNSTAYANGQYKIKKEASGGSKDNYDPLIELTKFIAEAPTNGTDVVEKWNEKIDVDSVLRFFTMDVLAGYSDGYLSNRNNFYVYQDLESNKFTYLCADMDLTLGNTLFKLQDMWSGNYTAFPGMYTRPLSKQMLLVPEFNEKYRQLLQNATDRLFNPEVTNTRIDDLANMIREDVAWDQTLTPLSMGLLAIIGPSLNLTAILGDPTPTGGVLDSPFDRATIMDVAERLFNPVPFDVAVNGPTGHISLTGVKEWFSGIHQNATRFFSQQ
ncbi:hypothetical protein G6F56_000505 [Rhizopus delemar]|nr:hypothetical protein G6F56_000505 [Rhizopus delemar]